MAILSEGKHAGEFIVSEANGKLSREAGVLASGNNLTTCSVLGQVVAGTATANVGNTGDGVVGAVTIGSNFQEGTYTLTCTAAAANAGTFSVVAPDGTVLPSLTVAVAYTGQINLTIADGATDFIVGDSVTVAVVVGNYAEFNPAGTNGTQVATGILFDNTDATLADTDCVVVKRLAEVRDSDLVWKTGTTTDQKTAAKAQLLKAFIVAR
jgi:hypothetical protein